MLPQPLGLPVTPQPSQYRAPHRSLPVHPALPPVPASNALADSLVGSTPHKSVLVPRTPLQPHPDSCQPAPQTVHGCSGPAGNPPSYRSTHKAVVGFPRQAAHPTLLLAGSGLFPVLQSKSPTPAASSRIPVSDL